MALNPDENPNFNPSLNPYNSAKNESSDPRLGVHSEGFESWEWGKVKGKIWGSGGEIGEFLEELPIEGDGSPLREEVENPLLKVKLSFLFL